MMSLTTMFDAPLALLQRLCARPAGGRLICLVIAVPVVAAAFAPVLLLASRM
jgi:hypothetical protein